MRTARIVMRGLAWIIIAMLMIPPGIPAQDATEPDQADMFRQEELAQMLAPIALYPDSLIALILMASTYPLEVVEAERWLRQNSGLKGDALDNALQEKTWDPSVESLCHFPDVLFAMSDKLDQTRKLGDAYLAQQEDVMATIQDLRRRAEEQGNLKTTKEQTVIDEDQDIRIEPADPQVVYVPAYNPFYAYGPWWYPAYPPWSWYYPPGVVITGGFIGFGPPFFIGFDLFSWCWFDWNSHFIFVNYGRTRHFHRHHRGDHDSGEHHWQHNPVHRRGVAYRDRGTSERFAQEKPRRSSVTRETRGYPAGTYERKPGEPSQKSVERQKTNVMPQQNKERERVRSSTGRETPFGGIDNGSSERRAGERGGESRRSSEPRYQGGNTGRQSSGPPSGSSQGSRPGGGQQGCRSERWTSGWRVRRQSRRRSPGDCSGRRVPQVAHRKNCHEYFTELLYAQGRKYE